MAWGRGAVMSLPGGKRPQALGRTPHSPISPAALWVWPPECPLLGFLFPEISPTSLLMALGKSLPLPVPPSPHSTR